MLSVCQCMSQNFLCLCVYSYALSFIDNPNTQPRHLMIFYRVKSLYTPFSICFNSECFKAHGGKIPILFISVRHKIWNSNHHYQTDSYAKTESLLRVYSGPKEQSRRDPEQKGKGVSIVTMQEGGTWGTTNLPSYRLGIGSNPEYGYLD